MVSVALLAHFTEEGEVSEQSEPSFGTELDLLPISGS
jgi:hypothetical protein